MPIGRPERAGRVSGQTPISPRGTGDTPGTRAIIRPRTAGPARPAFFFFRPGSSGGDTDRRQEASSDSCRRTSRCPDSLTPRSASICSQPAPGADARRFIIQSPLLLLAGEAGEFWIQRMSVGEKGFFAVQDGRVVRAGVIPVLNPKRLEWHEQRDGQRRMRVALKTGG